MVVSTKLQRRKALPKPRRKAWKKADAADSRRFELLLDAAAAEFNARGVSGARLAHIAKAVGIARAALYYYVDSREDLALHCYLRACRTAADDLAAAAAAPTGLARVQTYLARALDPERAPAVVLSEIAVLGTARAEVDAAHGRNVARLQRFIADGIADRSIRPCDAEVAAQAIVGMVAWVPLADEWAAGSGETVRRRAAQALSDLVTRGIAADRRAPFHCPLDAEAYAFKPGNAFDREAASALKVELLTCTASRLFNQRGIDGTSLDQITQELGATKGAFYQHISDKTALVAACHRRSMDLFEALAEAARRHGRNGLERAFAGLHLNVQAQAGALHPVSPLTGLEALPARVRKPIQQRGLALQQHYEKTNLDGIRDGSLRPFEVQTVTTTGAGVFGWIPKWRRPDDPRTPRQLADEIVALFARGLQND